MEVSWEIMGALAPYVAMIVGWIVVYVTMQAKVKIHEKILTSGENGSPPFITESRHDTLQESCQSKIYAKIKSIEATMKRGDLCRTEAREETSNQLSAMRKDIGKYQEKLERLLNPLVTQVALNRSEINHLKEDNKKG